MSEGHMTLETPFLDRDFKIDRGEMIFEDDGKPKTYLRYKDTPSGISPRAIPSLPNHLYVSGSDEHDEDGVLISDVYTDPIIPQENGG
jgi:2-oxoglutarate ferredoxin oxidoreductase subunit alpha